MKEWDIRNIQMQHNEKDLKYNSTSLAISVIFAWTVLRHSVFLPFFPMSFAFFLMVICLRSSNKGCLFSGFLALSEVTVPLIFPFCFPFKY